MNEIRRTTHRWVAIVIGGLTVALAQVAGALAQSYTVTDLGTLPGGFSSIANGINSAGQAAGYSFTEDFRLHATLFDGNTPTDLGTLGGDQSIANGINDAGQIVGQSLTDDRSTHAFLYDGDTMLDLGTLVSDCGPYMLASSIAYAINSKGDVVGRSNAAYPSPDFPDNCVATHGFLYRNGEMIDLGTLGGPNSQAKGVTDDGIVVGGSFTTDYQFHAFVWADGVMTDLDLGSPQAEALAVNRAGQIVGWFVDPQPKTFTHAFLYKDGTMTDLGTLGAGTYSVANAINNAGQVVGKSNMAFDYTFHAFLYSDGVMVDLNDVIPEDSALTLVEAKGINDAGQIVGMGYTPDYAQHAFLLTPAPPSKHSQNVSLDPGSRVEQVQ